MSKILIIFHQPVIDPNNNYGVICFYESLSKELIKHSNEVKCLNTYFLKKYQSENLEFLNKKEEEELLQKLKLFNPDIIFSFNNQITKGIIKITNCPICVFDADGVDLFVNSSLIKEYKDRYFMFSFYKGWEDERYKKLGFDKSKIIFLDLATAIKNEKLKKVSNISFIGTRFGPISQKNKIEILNSKFIYKDLQEYYKDPYANSNDFLNKYGSLLNLSNIDLYPLLDPRIYILQSLWDLGLDIYGLYWDSLLRIV